MVAVQVQLPAVIADSVPEPALLALLALGAAAAASALLQLAAALFRNFLRPAKNLRRLGEWAVVTGATGALGR